MTCLHTRDLLAEFAVDALSPLDRRRVERHLDSCPGCAKEAGELLTGASVAAFELPAVAPPPALEDRLVTRVTGEARRRAGRRRGATRALWVAAASAALLAAGALGGAFAMRGQVANLQSQVQSTRVTLRELEQLIRALSANGRVMQVQLEPVAGRAIGQGGTGIIFTSPDKLDWTFLRVVIAHPIPGTYRVVMATRGGRTIVGGALEPLGKNQYVLSSPNGPKLFTENLSQVAVVVVLDPDGRTLLRGTVRPDTGS